MQASSDTYSRGEGGDMASSRLWELSFEFHTIPYDTTHGSKQPTCNEYEKVIISEEDLWKGTQ